MHLPDINLWLALTFASHKHHQIAAAWFDDVEIGNAAFCRVTQLGFLRLATTPKVLAEDPLTLIQAWDSYDALFCDPRVVFSEEPAELELRWREFSRRRTFSPKVWNDAYLAGFVKAADFELVTFDKGFTQFKGIRCKCLS